MLMLAYSAALSLGLTSAAPWWLTRMLTTRRYREGLTERLGRVPQRLREAIRGKRVVWLHAVSVGEVLAASRLVQELGDALGAGWAVVISTTTRTGQALARDRFGAERVFYFPLDLRWAVRAYLRALRPCLLLLMESELWPRVLHECAGAGVPVAVLNARVSDRSFRRAMPVRSLWARLLGRATLWLAQTEADASRLIALGADPATVQVSGNLKYDIRAPQQSRVPTLIHDGAEGRPVIVAGSTTDDLRGVRGEWEEMFVIRAWEGAPRHEMNALLVLAPRHPERFGLVESLITEFAYIRATDLLAQGVAAFATYPGAEPAINEFGLKPFGGPHNFVPGHKGRIDIVLLDTIGDLAAVYGIADLAFVGGSLVRRGGHNLLEPAQFGVPILTGPSFENFREIGETLRAAGALCVIEDEDGLQRAMLRLLKDPAAAKAQGTQARQVYEREGGSTRRTLAALFPLLRGETNECQPKR